MRKLIVCSFLLLLCRAPGEAAAEGNQVFAQPEKPIVLPALESSENQRLVALDGGLLKPVADFVSLPMDGKRHWLGYAERDPQGNVSAIQWLLVVADGEAPEVQIEVLPSGGRDTTGKLWVGKNSVLKLVAQDAGSGVQNLSLSMNGQVFEGEEGELEAPFPAEGPCLFRVSSEDKVGNRKEFSVECRRDNTPPSLQLAASNGFSWLPASAVRLEPGGQLEIQQTRGRSPLGKVRYRFRGEVWKDGSTIFLPNLPGMHVIEVQAEDQLGNAAQHQWPLILQTRKEDNE